MQGFIVYDYAHRADEAYGEISSWLKSGKLHFDEVVHEGIESSPQALIDVLKGNGIGKHVIRIAGK
jgi:NADPH-dependent curcumin reductase CurA